MKNWRTSLCALLVGLCQIVKPMVPAEWSGILDPLSGIFTFFMGFFAKDYKVSGTGTPGTV